MLDIHEMQIFLAAAETGSFSEAGRRLQVSQPAISMQIRALEKRLNVELFHRSGRHITLSEIGHALVPLARDLVNHSTHVSEAIASLKGQITGTLKLACSTTAGKYILPRIIAGFVDEYPLVQVTCQVGSRGSAVAMLQDKEAQIAITSLREPSRELHYCQFMTDSVVLIASPDHMWAKNGGVHPDDLHEGRFIHRELNSGTQQTLIQELTRHDMSIHDLSAVMVLGNSEAISMAVAERIGVAFISRCAAGSMIESGRVVEVPVHGLEMSQQLYMVRLVNSMLPSAPSAFWDYVYAPENRDLLVPSWLDGELMLST